jgi:hypothetical protein
VLVDADSTPSVSVRKNGASVGDVVTVTKRAATTGIYDCSYNPAGEVEGDSFTIEETATVSSQAYENAWSIEAQAAERGTDASSVADAVWDESLSSHNTGGSAGKALKNLKEGIVSYEGIFHKRFLQFTNHSLYQRGVAGSKQASSRLRWSDETAHCRRTTKQRTG